MSVVLVGDRFIKCEIMVRGVEIHRAIIILRVCYGGRVWVVYCYRSIPHLTVGCLHACAEKSLQLERQMIQCLTALKCTDVKPLQEYIIKECRVYFTREQIKYIKTEWLPGVAAC
jgi:hypothetical protein